MTVLIVASFADSLIKFRGDLIKEMLKRKQVVHVAFPFADESINAQLNSWGVVCHHLPLNRTGMNPISDAFLLYFLYRLISQIRPGTVLSYTIKPVIYGSLAARLAGVKRIYALITGLGYAFQGDNRRGLLRSLVQKLYRFALSGTKKVFFQNPDDRDLFRQLGIIATDKATYVVNGSGVDIRLFDISPLPALPVKFLLIARLLGDKGIREYIEAAKQIKLKHPNVTFYLVGWIDENPNAIKQYELDEWIAKGYVEFLGRLNDVRPAIALASVYVLPSYREGTPRTVLEAMAQNRAVITTDAPGCRETVIDGYNGFLVPVKSVDALSEAMEKFIINPELIQSMGKAARQLAEDKYDVNQVNATMLSEMDIL